LNVVGFAPHLPILHYWVGALLIKGLLQLFQLLLLLKVLGLHQRKNDLLVNVPGDGAAMTLPKGVGA
jgi:hypothetical protein